MAGENVGVWWPDKPVLEMTVRGSITDRTQAFALAEGIVDQIESTKYSHVILVLDLNELGRSPSAAVLLGGALPETNRIEHLVMMKCQKSRCSVHRLLKRFLCVGSTWDTFRNCAFPQRRECECPFHARS
jgi:hypothetical protein